MKTIYLIGLGPGDPWAVTVRSLAVLKNSKHVYVRTARHPGLKLLDHYGIAYKPLDFFYRKGTAFEGTYRNIAYFVLNAALNFGRVAYAVPGSPLFAEKTVEIILDKAAKVGIRCRILPAVSFLEAVSAELRLPREQEFVVVNALQPELLLQNADKHKIIIRAYNGRTASAAKLQLLQLYPENHPVTVLHRASLPGARRVTVPLYKMDRVPFIDHLTTFYLPPLAGLNIDHLLQVMRRLRSTDGCPWDREQDHNSLKQYLLEEAYEVLDAINRGSSEDLCEELGDLLLQIVFHSEIASENRQFNFYDVVAGIVGKMIRRHPHVFGSGNRNAAVDVLLSWRQLKKEEYKERDSLFTLEMFLPALLRAQKLQRQAAAAGFDWPDAAGAWDKLREEMQELEDAYNTGSKVKIMEELGDLLFAVVNVARFLSVDAEQALSFSTDKFYRRLRFIEEKARKEGGDLSTFSLSKLDEWWNLAKKRLN